MDNTTKIDSLEAAYKAVNFDASVNLFQNPSTDYQRSANGFTNACVLTEALNMDKNGNKWIPDYDDYQEDKYEIIWDMRSEAAGGPGFSYTAYACGLSRSYVGARLVFRDRKTARYAAETFPDIYREFITIRKE